MRIELALRVADDFERIVQHLVDNDVALPAERLATIRSAIAILATSPLLGRPAARGNRELIIGRRGQGYVALYRYFPKKDLVLVLAIRGQREAGYKETSH